MKIERISKFLFLLIIFFISSQVGLHFWPKFSSVAGIRIDYLSPTIYFLDILIVAWILVWAVRDIRVFRVMIKENGLKLLLFLFLLSIVWNILYAKSLGAHFFGIIKLGELGLFGALVAKTFAKNYIRPFVLTLASSAVFSSFLAIWQFAKQSSVGGLWYFFGERTFNASTIGISTVNLEQQILRPYASFPHPNVLAFFLFTAIVFIVLRIEYEKIIYGRIFLYSAVFISSVALSLTFSRVSILLFILFWFYIIFAKLKKNWCYFVFSLIGLFMVGASMSMPNNLPFNEFFLRGIDFRLELLVQSFQIFLGNPYFGIGLNNFFVHQLALIKDISPILFQPPHNIFVIALLSLGIFGWWVFPAIFIWAIRSAIKEARSMNYESRDFYRGVLLVLISVIVVGMFDHFFLTLEQGQIMLALILGLSFAKLR